MLLPLAFRLCCLPSSSCPQPFLFLLSATCHSFCPLLTGRRWQHPFMGDRGVVPAAAVRMGRGRIHFGCQTVCSDLVVAWLVSFLLTEHGRFEHQIGLVRSSLAYLDQCATAAASPRHATSVHTRRRLKLGSSHSAIHSSEHLTKRCASQY